MAEGDAKGGPSSPMTPEERAADVYDAIMTCEHGPDSEVATIADAIRAAVAEERKRIAAQVKDSCAPGWGDRLADLIRSGGGFGERFDPAAEEREACAAVAEHYGDGRAVYLKEGETAVWHEIADAIRARGATDGR